MAFPVRTLTRPGALVRQRNGQLSGSVMAETPGLAGGPGVLLTKPAHRAWRALTAAAAKAGHTLRISHPNSAYRPYADQERIFRDRYRTYDTGNERRYWPGHGYWWRRDGAAAAAVPGTSNHGWGLAVDVGEERDGDSGAESIDAGTLAWLVANEERFGWSHEIQSEPWHIRYFTGDHIPQAVLDHERSTSPTPHPAPLLEGDDVFTYEYDIPGSAPKILVLVAGGKQVRLNGAAVLATRRKSPEHLGDIDTATYDRMTAAYGKVIGI